MIQRRHALFEHSIGGVRQTRVNVSCPLDIKQACRRVGIGEDKRRTLVNGRCPSTSGGIWYLACVQRQGVKPHTLWTAVFGISHVLSLLRAFYSDRFFIFERLGEMPTTYPSGSNYSSDFQCRAIGIRETPPAASSSWLLAE